MNAESSAAPAVLGGLLSALRDPSDETRRRAAWQIRNLGPVANSEPVIAALLDALEDTEHHVRRFAAMAIAASGAAGSKPVADRILRLLGQPRGTIKIHGIMAILYLGEGMRTCAGVSCALVALLDDGDARVRMYAAQSLAHLYIGRESEIGPPVLDRFAEMLGDPDPGVVFITATAVRNLGGVVVRYKPVRQALARLLDNANPHIARAAAAALASRRRNPESKSSD